MNNDTKRFILHRIGWSLAGLAFLAGYHHADAQEAPHVELLVMGKSWHFGHNVPHDTATMHYYGPSYNDYNPGLGLEYRWPNGFFVGGAAYYDSYRKTAYTMYGGYQLTWHVSSSWGLFAAARAGYLNGSNINGPVVIPSVGVQYKRVSLEAEVIPKMKSSGVNCIGLFARWRF